MRVCWPLLLPAFSYYWCSNVASVLHVAARLRTPSRSNQRNDVSTTYRMLIWSTLALGCTKYVNTVRWGSYFHLFRPFDTDIQVYLPVSQPGP